MPRRTINHEGDAANLLADSMVKLIRSRGDNLSCNDLHALNKSLEVYLYAREVHRTIKARARVIGETGIDPVQMDIDHHRIMRRIKHCVEDHTGQKIDLPKLPPLKPTAKPQSFRTAEKNLAKNATIKAGLPKGRNNKKRVQLKPSPMTVGRIRKP